MSNWVSPVGMGRRELVEHFSDHDMTGELAVEIFQAARRLPEWAPFVEVGTRNGGSALVALNAIRVSDKPRRWLFTIDPYGMKPWRETGRDMPGMYPDYHYRTAMRALSEYAHHYDLNHHHFRMTSQDWIRTFPDVHFWIDGEIFVEEYGFVYLDGEHSCDSVLTEMDYFAPRMVKGGLIVVDDLWLLEKSGEVRDELYDVYLKDAETVGEQAFWTRPR